MNEYIDFKPQKTQISEYIRFSLTKTAFLSLLKISNNQEEAINKLVAFSQNKVLVFTPGRDRSTGKIDPTGFKIITNQGVFLCKIADNYNSLSIVDFHVSSLMDQNDALKNGVYFQIHMGIIVQIMLGDPYGLFFDIFNGDRHTDIVMKNVLVSAAIDIIRDRMGKTDRENEDDLTDEEYQPEKKLLNLLNTAEKYSILSSELEEKKAHDEGNVPYLSISSVEYDRIDRVVYQFEVDHINENNFKVHTQVEIEDKNQKKHTAEIIELVKANMNSPAVAIKLLFTEQIDISEFNQSGFFNLSFSTVNRDVQLAAIERIKTGKAVAKYMDNILGRSEPSGFDNNDLSDVRRNLMTKKYPPNESQMNAIFSGINAKDVFLVMGPPGTGKTTVILEWVKYFVKKGKRVLVSSQNNKAVDNVLARIADEKDIDIIRVGSEVKLQSEVVPYLFENKVATLRNNISVISDKKINDLNEIIYEWKQYYLEVAKVVDLIYKMQNSRKQFEKVVMTELIPLYKKLQGLYNEYIEVTSQEKSSFYYIKLYKERIEKVKATSRIRLFVRASYEKNYKKIRDEILNFNKLKSRENAIVEEYNDLISEYTKIYDRVKLFDFTSLYADMMTKSASMEKMSNSPQRMEKDIWGIFNNCSGIKVTSDTDCFLLLDRINTNIRKATQLKDAIFLWKNEVDGHQNYALNEIVLESVDLVGATCIGINSQKKFANLDFDVTIIDEAGQIQVHNALVPMSVSNKLIMLGDHKQIPPNADTDLVGLCEENGVNPDLLAMSLFEKMYNELPKTNKIMLDTQYRMPAEIADTISEWFYDGKYYSPDFKRGMKSIVPQLSSCPYVIIDTSNEKGRGERKIEDAGCDNNFEAEIIKKLVSVIVGNVDNNIKEIGVISAYKSQVNLIKNKLNLILSEEIVNEMVATLDSYQGQERDIIIYSFTKSSKEPSTNRRIGFLSELRRLNVAMTRCKKMLVLIGDMQFLGSCLHCDKDDEGIPIYDKSEKQFADFIKKMLLDVERGRGEIITYKEFSERME